MSKKPNKVFKNKDIHRAIKKSYQTEAEAPLSYEDDVKYLLGPLEGGSFIGRRNNKMLEVSQICGLDLGQVSDFTALISLRREIEVPDPPSIKAVDPNAPVDWDALIDPPRPDKATAPLARYYCTIAKRYERGTDYTDLASRICRLFQEPKYAGQTLVIDGTGVGRGVVDIFRKARPNCRMMPVTITGGANALGSTSVDDLGYWHVPKKELVSSVQVLLVQNRLEVASTLQHATVLVNELKSFTYKINAVTANISYSAWREKDHDDMVLGLALAAWAGERARQQLWIL